VSRRALLSERQTVMIYPKPVVRSLIRRVSVAAAFAVAFASTGCDETRISVSPSALVHTSTPVADHPAIIADAKAKYEQVGSSTLVVLTTWAALERAPQTLDFGSLATTLDTLAPQGGSTRQVLLQVAPIFTAARTVPAYLMETQFDAPEMIDAFRFLWDGLDEFLLGYPHLRFVISIGNEINVYLDVTDQTGGDSWGEYGMFFAKAAPYVRAGATRPQVGITWAWKGAQGATENMVAASNVDIYTFYPGQPWYPEPVQWTDNTDTASSNMSQVVNRAIDKMAALGRERVHPVYIQEVGYQAREWQYQEADAGTLVEFPKRQDAFVNAVFDALDGVNTRAAEDAASRDKPPYFPIQLVNFFQLHDFSSKIADAGNHCGGTFAFCGGLGVRCCSDPATCGELTGRCVRPSICDNVAGAFLGGSALGHCTLSSECAAHEICTSGQRCVDAAARARTCSWGLIDDDGNPRPGWDTLLERAQQ
jgi:hypothetical protein